MFFEAVGFNAISQEERQGVKTQRAKCRRRPRWRGQAGGKKAKRIE